MSTTYRLFFVVAPGLEAAAADELRVSCALDGRVIPGGIEVTADADATHRAIRTARIPDAVRVRVGTFVSRNFDELMAGVGATPWHAWLDRGAEEGPEIRVTCRKSALYHSDAVAERVALAIADACGPAGGVVHVRLLRDKATLSVELANERHKRGWPRHVVAGSLRETLAAACVRLSGALDAPVLWDPYCGSGTLGMEWMAARAGGPAVAPDRVFEVASVPSLRAGAATIAAGPATVESSTGGPDTVEPGAVDAPSEPVSRFIGSDIAKRAIAAARFNAVARGMEFELHVADAREAAKHAPQGAAVLTNLPYGKRVSGARAALAALGDVLRARADLTSVHALDGTGSLAKVTGMTWNAVTSFQNRGLRVQLMRLER